MNTPKEESRKITKEFRNKFGGGSDSMVVVFTDDINTWFDEKLKDYLPISLIKKVVEEMKNKTKYSIDSSGYDQKTLDYLLKRLEIK